MGLGEGAKAPAPSDDPTVFYIPNPHDESTQLLRPQWALCYTENRENWGMDVVRHLRQHASTFITSKRDATTFLDQFTNKFLLKRLGQTFLSLRRNSKLQADATKADKELQRGRRTRRKGAVGISIA